MKVFIYAYETNYMGLHGIFTQAVTDVDSLHEAEECGHDMALDLYSSYSCLMDDLEDYDENEKNEIIEDNLCYGIYKIKDEYQNMTTYELDNICADHEATDFIDEYCIGEEPQ